MRSYQISQNINNHQENSPTPEFTLQTVRSYQSTDAFEMLSAPASRWRAWSQALCKPHFEDPAFQLALSHKLLGYRWTHKFRHSVQAYMDEVKPWFPGKLSTKSRFSSLYEVQ